MEKFGIFELLDALSALTEGTEKNQEVSDSEIEPPQSSSAEEKEQNPTARKIKTDQALEGFYARHAAVARKAAKKKTD